MSPAADAGGGNEGAVDVPRVEEDAGDDDAVQVPSPCGDSPACAPGDVDEIGCGRCGTQRRFCGIDCEWGSFGVCGGEGGCSPGDARLDACGPCAVRDYVCNDVCVWSGGPCRQECEGDESETTACGRCGTHTRTCRGGCWQPWTECVGQHGEAPAGWVQYQPCECSGLRHRIAGPDCVFGGWSECEGGGPGNRCGGTGAGPNSCVWMHMCGCSEEWYARRECGGSGHSKYYSCGGDGCWTYGGTVGGCAPGDEGEVGPFPDGCSEIR